MVVVAAFRVRSEADGARDTLVANGMAAEVRPYSDAFERRCEGAFESGFDLLVAERDADAAITALQRLWPDDLVIEPERCPACGSIDVARLPRLRIFVTGGFALLLAGLVTGQRDLFLLVVAILGVLLVLSPPRRCRACGERWR